MIFEVVTLFPEFFKPYFAGSILGRAVKNNLIKVNFLSLRNFSSDKKHRRVDDKVYGGGPGMVLLIEPILRAVRFAFKGKNSKTKSKSKIILFSANGKQFTQKMASLWSKKAEKIVFISGRYEGVDERIKKAIKDSVGISVEEISIGPYTLSGGELPAMVLIDAISRHIPGVLGKEESLEEKRLGIGVPVYTRPDIFIYKKKRYSVPKVLKSGNHKAILNWRLSRRKLSAEGKAALKANEAKS